MDIGTRISYFRNAKQYSVNRLATLAGISQSYLRDVELGKKNPTVEVLSYICDALDLSLRDFFDDKLESRFCQDPLDVYKRQAVMIAFGKVFIKPRRAMIPTAAPIPRLVSA